MAHKDSEEAYICIYSHRNGDTILFHHEGGVEIGDVDAKALKLEVDIDGFPSAEEVNAKLLTNVADDKKARVNSFILDLYRTYVDVYFTYLEINPLG